MKCKKLQKNNIWQCAKAERGQNEEQERVFKSKISYRWSGMKRKITKPCQTLKSTQEIHKTGCKTHYSGGFSTLMLNRLQTKQILAFFMDFIEVMQSTFAQQGAGRDKKENFAVCKVVFFSTVSHLSVH